MEKEIERVINTCIKMASDGVTGINVFDLMYETCLPYPELKAALDKLVGENQLEAVNVKTYKFIGDINRKSEAAPKQDKLAEKRAELERKRQDIIRKMQENLDSDEQYCVGEPVLAAGDFCGEESAPYKTNTLFEFIKNFINDRHRAGSAEEIPDHAAWEDEDCFLDKCADCLMLVVASDKNMGRQGAIKKAQDMLEEVCERRIPKYVEVYERVVYELQNMSNYYYLKIRDWRM